MIAGQQKALIIQLEMLRKKIIAAKERYEVSQYLKDAIDAARFVQPVVLEVYGSLAVAEEGKRLILGILESDSESVLDSTYYDLETIRFQAASSIVLLMLKFADSIEKVNEIIRSSSTSTMQPL